MRKRDNNLVSRVATGGILIVLGGVFAVLSFFDLWFLVYALPLLAVGLLLFFNDKEDDIEQIKK